MLAALTGLGLSAAAGFNAYIPFLIVACAARFTTLVTLPPEFAWIESWWAITGAAVLLVVEMTVDKIAVVDHVNDAVGTFLRPMTGGLVFAATSAADSIDNSQWMAEHPWVGVIAGIIVAGIVHSGKAAARPVVNASTAGVGAPVVSVAEDAAAISLSVVAVLAPLFVLVLLVVLAWIIWSLWRRFKRLTARRRPDPEYVPVSS
ncbi:DUF4126 domain-containing protein [Kytococcus sedentarius]|uniref:DUF4126 domain-containing protein n=1 Tax=Kytococcus sedentarius TaxID=1276 RepID=UPI0035BC7254